MSEAVIMNVVQAARQRPGSSLPPTPPRSPRLSNAAPSAISMQSALPHTPDEQLTLLRAVIRQELLLLQTTVISEIHMSTGECTSKTASIMNAIKQLESKVGEEQQALFSKQQVESQSRREDKEQQNKRDGTSATSSTEQGELPSSAWKELSQDGPMKREVSPGVPSDGSVKDDWADFAKAVDEIDEQHNLYLPIMERIKNQEKSVWHNLLEHFNMGHLVVALPPTHCLARATEHPVFSYFQTLLILANTALMGFEADVAIKSVLEVPQKDVPDWIDLSNMAFTIVFALELLFRITALRSWFFVAPSDWAWNFFDVFVVASSIITDFILTGINLSFIRAFRMLRALRAMRIIRVLRFFRRLREMMFAILASMSSLVWFFVFLSGVMFMFSILILQGLTFAVEDMPKDDVVRGLTMSDQLTPLDGDAWKVAQIQEWYGSLADSMFALLLSVSGGQDWGDLREPLLPAGPLYTAAFIIYILFVTVGVINVLVGVFVASAGDNFDQSLIVVNEQIKADKYVKHTMDMFNELDLSHSGRIDWPTFQKSLKNESMQAYLSSLDLEPTHARLVFDLLDVRKDGTITMEELLMGFMRLKGEAKAIDARTIQRQVTMLPKLLAKDFEIGMAKHANFLSDTSTM